MNDDAASMLRQWWSALPGMFPSGMLPWMQALNEGGATAGPLPTDDASILSFDQLLTALFEAWQPLLHSGGLATNGLLSLVSQVEAGFGKLRESLTSSSATPTSFGWPLPMAPMSWGSFGAPLLLAAGNSAGGGRSNPLQVGADRTFGAIADAFGLRPMRDMQEAWIALGEAEAERRAAQTAYLALAARAWSDGIRRLVTRLEQMRRAGEQVTTFLAFVRLWARETDAALHEAMQSQEGLAAAARAVRASSRQRDATQRLVALTSQALNVPTRAEVDDAYREIQELKRELRRLKKGEPQGRSEAQASTGKARTRKADH